MTRVTPDFAQVRQAALRIAAWAHRTPVLTSRLVDERAGARIHFKCEHLQRVGAFKFRGASNAVLSLDDAQAARGVATHSSGNHAAALALAARLRGIPAYVVMPSNAPAAKVAAVRAYGAQITFCEPTLEARERTLDAVLSEHGAEPVHPYNDERVIAGQGTAALELIDEVGDLDIIMTPVGGGGLLSGTAITTHALLPAARVIAAEPMGASDAWQSLRAGHIIPSVAPHTIADGLLTSLGDKTWPIIHALVHDIVLADDAAIIDAMRFVWERMKLVVEPSAVVTLAAIFSGAVDVRDMRVGIILSGGNLDLDRLPWQSVAAS